MDPVYVKKFIVSVLVLDVLIFIYLFYVIPLDSTFLLSVARGLRPANGISLHHWTLQHLLMQWSRYTWIMLVIW